MPWEDPIVAEVRQIREELGAKFNFDPSAVFADMRKRQAKLGKRVVSPTHAKHPTDRTLKSPPKRVR